MGNTTICLPQKAGRNSALELLRILSMLFIVLSHACGHSRFDLSTAPLSFNRLFIQWGILGNLGVDIFVMISGYFLYQKRFHIASLTKLFVQVWSYSFLLYLVCCFGFGYNYSFKALLTVFLPTIFGEYWFFTAYIILYLLSPYFNILIENADRSKLRTLLALLLTLWVLIPTFTAQQMFSSKIPQFLLFYLIGAYFKKYADNNFQRKNIRIFVTVICFLLLFLSTVILDCLSAAIPQLSGKGNLFYSQNSLLIVGCATGLFSIAIYHKPFTNPIINTIAGCTFGVYLIHDNPAVRDILWTQLLHNAAHLNSPFLVLRLLGCTLLVFTVCALVEYLRQKTIAKPLENAVNNLLSFVTKLIKKILRDALAHLAGKKTAK